jgi:hypothetical protein
MSTLNELENAITKLFHTDRPNAYFNNLCDAEQAIWRVGADFYNRCGLRNDLPDEHTARKMAIGDMKLLSEELADYVEHAMSVAEAMTYYDVSQQVYYAYESFKAMDSGLVEKTRMPLVLPDPYWDIIDEIGADTFSTTED